MQVHTSNHRGLNRSSGCGTVSGSQVRAFWEVEPIGLFHSMYRMKEK